MKEERTGCRMPCGELIIIVLLFIIIVQLCSCIKEEYGTKQPNDTIKIDSSILYAKHRNINSVMIGTQSWMTENLKVTTYNDGTHIPIITDNDAWKSAYTPAMCWYNGGALYNWYAVNTNKICPIGWHVPSDGDWKTLEIYLGMSQQEADQQYQRGDGIGTLLKAIDCWYILNGLSDNYHFSARSTGFRSGYYGDFWDWDNAAYWWSSTSFNDQTAWFRNITNEPTIYRGNVIKSSGFSVRCVKN